MVLRLDGDRRGASLISFPRDMDVSILGHGMNKIIAAYAFGGAPLTVRTTEGLLDVRMDQVARIDFAGFIALTDGIGGVTVDEGLTTAQLRKTALSVRFTPDDLISIQAPIDGSGTSPTGQSIDEVDTDRLKALVDPPREDGVDDHAARYPNA